MHKEFEINKLDLAASRMQGQPLNLSTVDSASYKVSLLEAELIIKGWSRDGTDYDIQGLYEAAGNDYSAAKDFGTGTNIPDAVNRAIGLLLADSIYPPYNLVLNPTQYAEAS